ncbi:MAG TPA: MBL fold metallo-hydrolase [Candidatus Staskawiczbacteria bacterium]|nr:MBL fold metallo-hydrolase [Candidatus Staskawiczbacteria bacterium]
MKITFLGAAQNVTGSKHLIQTENYNLLLDCGFYQGKRKDSNQQNTQLPFDAGLIDAVVLSHAHLDHSGSLPTLTKNGYKGKIYCTKATAEISKFILLDSANIQVSDAEYLNKHRKEGQELVLPIYNEDDVKETLEHFETVDYHSWIKLNDEISFKLYEAGHILGSATVLVKVTENGSQKTLLFTGDLGREIAPILKSPEQIDENVDYLVSECTYGNRLHRPMQEAQEDLIKIISQVEATGGKIIIPAFSLGRTQEIVYILHKLFNEKKVPAIPVYIDSPLTANITEIFRENTDWFDDEFYKDFGKEGESPFDADNIFYTRTTEESKSLNEKQGPFIIISASGMAEGGRVLHHLKNNIGDENNIILIAGYQAENTLGRRIRDGITPVKIYGELYDVKARVITMNEFSAHADQKELLDYIKSLKGLKKIFLVHSEMAQAQAFDKILKDELKGVQIDIPHFDQSETL